MNRTPNRHHRPPASHFADARDPGRSSLSNPWPGPGGRWVIAAASLWLASAIPGCADRRASLPAPPGLTVPDFPHQARFDDPLSERRSGLTEGRAPTALRQPDHDGTGDATQGARGTPPGRAQGRWTMPSALDVEARLAVHAHPVPDDAPHAVARLPAGLNASCPLHLVVFLHGWRGCARALIGAGAIRCHDGGGSQPGWDLGARHDAAGTNTILVIPQLAFRSRDGSPGRFAEPGVFAAMLAEFRSQHLAPMLPGDGCRAPPALTLVAHSAGYETALAILGQPEISTQVAHVVLMDALYAGADRFAAWAAGAEDRRLLSLYAGHGPTHRQSLALARRVQADLGDDAVVVDPDGGWTEAVVSHRVVVDESRHAHGQIPMRTLTAVLRALPLPRR